MLVYWCLYMEKSYKIYKCKDFDSAFEVDNYPWGFRLKTKVRYWIETTNRGDRFVKCTLNPKTNKWCKEKKSTYQAVMVMTAEVKDQKTFVSYIAISRGWSDAVAVVEVVSHGAPSIATGNAPGVGAHHDVVRSFPMKQHFYACSPPGN